MADVIEEALAEASGRSSKRWALLLAAFILGLVAALRLVVWLRSRNQPPEEPPAGVPASVPAGI